jgi:hypothetical protein
MRCQGHLAVTVTTDICDELDISPDTLRGAVRDSSLVPATQRQRNRLRPAAGRPATLGYYRAMLDPAKADPRLEALRQNMNRLIVVPTLALCGALRWRRSLCRGGRGGPFPATGAPGAGHATVARLVDRPGLIVAGSITRHRCSFHSVDVGRHALRASVQRAAAVAVLVFPARPAGARGVAADFLWIAVCGRNQTTDTRIFNPLRIGASSSGDLHIFHAT